ncbi:DUF11 domain-containing protein [Myroides odoratus]|uniref:DUF11 domain-containing protein n=1 Tax=Myroides odoratus TaxID=256 RepID=UPI000765F339|nr:DUF11 domain-containing protein [Myroides odoratus]
MRHKKYNVLCSKQAWTIFLFSFLFGLSPSWAEGSKDLFPQNARGTRLQLVIYDYLDDPYFLNFGTHFVYAEEGEQIALASDVQENGTRKIFLYAPNGAQIVLPLSGQSGTIPNRTAELAGPRLPGQIAGSNRYLPVYYTVPTGGSGIYKVEFYGPNEPGRPGTKIYEATRADRWPEKPLPINPNLAHNVIAWDVSVAKRNGTDWTWVNGRTYTNTLNLHASTFRPEFVDYFNDLKFKVLTSAGYVYNFNLNDFSHQKILPICINNIGISKEGEPTVPAYLSWPTFSTLAEYMLRYHNPNLPDTPFISTAKIFYNLPDKNMPEKAKWAQTGQETWLKVKEKTVPRIDTVITAVGADGTPNKIGSKGGYIEFDSSENCHYEIVIKPKENNLHPFPQRILKGTRILGANRIYWDGKDGAGNFVTAKQVEVEVTLTSYAHDTHFLLGTYGYNTNGIIIERLSTDYQSVVSDNVHWDDTLLDTTPNQQGRSNPINASHFVNPAGVSSRSNGHKWGTSAPTSFGFNQLMDTWTFIEGGTFSDTLEVEMIVTDLAIAAVTTDQIIVRKNDSLTYVVKVINYGPTAVEGAGFTFDFPTGFEPLQVQFSGNTCGTERVSIAYDAVNQSYTSQLDLPVACEVIYTIQLKAINPVVGPVKVEATILRPDDIYDPDATNPNPAIPPTDAHYECENNGLSTPCNNIKKNQEVIYTLAGLKLIKHGVFRDANNNGSPQVGETITYTFKLTNTGETKLTNLVLTDFLLGGVITAVPEKSMNEDDFLDVNEVWTYNQTYVITQLDLDNKGVYNQAEVKGIEEGSNHPLEEKSRPAVLLTPTDVGYDPNRKEHTFVSLVGTNVLITNPMIRQRLKK